MKTQENSIIINIQYKTIKDRANQININNQRNSRIKNIVFVSKNNNLNNLYLKYIIEEIKNYFLNKKNSIYYFYIIKMFKNINICYYSKIKS